MRSGSRAMQRGNSIVEFALVALVLMFALLAAFEGGMYTYAFISVENAARAAALRNAGGLDSAADTAGACRVVLEELRGLPNMGSVTACDGDPVSVTSILLCATSPCSGSASSPDGQPAAMVVVTYTLPPLFQVPLAGPLTLSRATELRLRSIQ